MRTRKILQSFVVTGVILLLVILPAGSSVADPPVWSTPLALGPTDVTSISARDGLVVAGGRLHEKGAFGGGSRPIPAAPRVAGIFRSTDQGRTWTLGRERAVGVDGQVELRPIDRTPALVLVPPTGHDAFAFFGSTVWRSDDDALTWAPIGDTGGTPVAAETLADGRIVVGLTSGGLRASGDRGATWTQLGSGLPASRVNEILAYSPTLILVATEAGLYRSTDGGSTFTQATQGIAQPSASALGVAGSGGLQLFLAMPAPGLTGTAIYTSTDGQTWQPRSPIASQNVLPRVNPGSFVAVQQGSTYVLYAGTPVGLFRSGNVTAAGLAWERLDPEPGATSVGSLAAEDVDASPAGKSFVVYGAVRRASPVVSGATQTRLAAPGWIDELEGGRICGGLVARKDGVLFAACGRHVFRSDDAGATWIGAGNGLPYVSAGIGDTPYNPLVAAADGSLWTSGFDYGLYHSNPGVTQWTKVPFPGGSVGAIATHPTDPNTIYAAGLATNGCCTVLLFKSTDGGTTWGRPILDVSFYIYNISVSPSAPAKVLVAGFNHGAYLSEDGGATWRQPTGLSGDVYRVFYTPASSTRAWALTSEGLFRSDDAGRTFDFVGPITIDGKEKTSFEIVVSPWDPDTVYSLPIDGDLAVTHDGGDSWALFDTGLPKDACTICEEISNLVFDPSARAGLWITAGVLGDGADPESMWVYRATDGAGSAA